VGGRERFEHGQPRLRQLHLHASPVRIGAFSLHQAVRGRSVDQLDGRVVSQVEPLGDLADGNTVLRPDRLNGQQELVLLRVDARLACRLFTEMEEMPDRSPELVEPFVIALPNSGHETIIS
jgi:hypothetical protein